MHFREYKKGEQIFRKGDEADYFYFILRGEINLHRGTVSRVESILRIMHAGESLGEKGVIALEPRSLSASAGAKTWLISVNATDFRKIIGMEVKMRMDEKMDFVEK